MIRLRRVILSLGCVLAAGVLPDEAVGQDVPTPTGPCRDAPCRLMIDWGAGTSAASYGADRRYGPAADIEPLLKQYLTEHRLRMVESGADAMLVTVRPTVKNAMCDQMAGTSTDMSCRTIDELTIQFTSSDPAVKAPGSMRVANRCGAGDTKMTVAQMARYAADFMAYNLAVDKKGLKRAVARC
ncbi:MAG: hypothetical protein ACT4P7_06685 [Gemmatimonadaceae bacterium]